MWAEANYYRTRSKEKRQVCSIVLKPASGAVGSDGSFLFAAYTRKNVL